MVTALAEGVRVEGAVTPDGPDAMFRAWYGQLAGWCLHLTGDPDSAQDIAAEAFTRLLSRFTTVREPQAFLYVTALNLVRDQWRRRESERRGLSRLGTEAAGTAVAAGADSTDAPELWLLVRQLPDRARSVLLLHYYADLPVIEVARALGVAPGTVKRDLFEARALMARRLEGTR